MGQDAPIMGGAEINELEQLVLLALVRLGDEAYGVTVRAAIEERAGRSVSIAAVYAALARMEERGWLEAWLSEPMAVRGGRARKHFRITAAGAAEVRGARRRMEEMWRGLELHPDLRGSQRP
jgi:DNA-binding PadR family transcriptional regulator